MMNSKLIYDYGECEYRDYSSHITPTSISNLDDFELVIQDVSRSFFASNSNEHKFPNKIKLDLTFLDSKAGSFFSILFILTNIENNKYSIEYSIYPKERIELTVDIIFVIPTNEIKFKLIVKDSNSS